MRATLLGVRGSTPSPGADFVRYGGHTSCVALYSEGAEHPTLVLDAGTGLRGLSELLEGAAYEGAILLSHLHWDHMEGLPFCRAGDRDEARVDLYVPEQDGKSGRDLLAQAFSPPAFPITPEGLHGDWHFHGLAPGEHRVEGFDVVAAEIAHKGGRTFGYRVDDGSGALAYLPDHDPTVGLSGEARDLIRGADVLLHDAQFLDVEHALARDYGHATVEDCVRLAKECDVRRLVLFHHSPARTDDALDEIAAWAPRLANGVPVEVARQGLTLHVERRQT